MDTDQIIPARFLKTIQRTGLGKSLFANIVALGALVRITGIVDFDTIKTCVAHRVPPHTVDKNMQALQVGWDAAAKA